MPRNCTSCGVKLHGLRKKDVCTSCDVRTCPDCGSSVSRKSKTGYCQPCAVRRFKPDKESRAAAGQKTRERHLRNRLEREGVAINYHMQHRIVEKTYGYARDHACIACGGPAREWAYQHTAAEPLYSPEGWPYSLDVSDYAPMCHACHRALDGRGVGRVVSDETRARMSAALTGRTLSPDHREKVANAARKFWHEATAEQRSEHAQAVSRARRAGRRVMST